MYIRLTRPVSISRAPCRENMDVIRHRTSDRQGDSSREHDQKAQAPGSGHELRESGETGERPRWDRRDLMTNRDKHRLLT